MIDRQSRDKVLKLLTAYMDGKKRMQSLDLAVFDLEQTTDDELIALAGQIIWLCIDRGNGEKRFEGNRDVWNLLCRLKLLLSSDVEIKLRKTKRWNSIQPIAFFSFIVLFSLLIYVGSLQNGILFWSYMFLCGLWTWFLSKKHDEALEHFNREEVMLSRLPFNSFGEILAVRRSVPAFRKTPFPSGFPERSIDQEEPPGPFGLFCRFVFVGFIFLALWFGPLFQLVFRDDRAKYEFRIGEKSL